MLVELHSHIGTDYKYKDPGTWTNHLLRWRFLAVFFVWKKKKETLVEKRRFSIWLNHDWTSIGVETTTNQTRGKFERPTEKVIQAVTKRISPDLGGHLYNLWINGSLKNILSKTRSRREDLLFFVVCELFVHLRMPPDPKQKNKPWFLASVFLVFAPTSFGIDSKTQLFGPQIWIAEAIDFSSPCPMVSHVVLGVHLLNPKINI